VAGARGRATDPARICSRKLVRAGEVLGPPSPETLTEPGSVGQATGVAAVRLVETGTLSRIAPAPPSLSGGSAPGGIG
jgi:hypothetical protein